METKQVDMSDEALRDLFARKHDRPGDEFLRIMARDDLVVAPGTFSAMDAQMASMVYQKRHADGLPCAFNAVYGSGWAASVMDLALPDMGFHDRTRIVEKARYLAWNAFPLPLVMDAEAGFGGELHIPLLVRQYHEVGVAVAHLEDQVGDRRFCGHMAGRQVVPIEDAEKKIRSWLVASEAMGTSMLLMARTDAVGAVNGGLNEAIERGKRYMDVSYKNRRVALLWAEFDTPDPDPIERWTSAMQKHDPTMPLALNYSPNKDWPEWYRKNRGTPPPTYQQLRGLGYRLIFHTILTARAAMMAVYDVTQRMAESGPEALWKLQDEQRSHPAGDPQGMSNAPAWQAFDQWLNGDAGIARYEQSGGYKKEK